MDAPGWAAGIVLGHDIAEVPPAAQFLSHVGWEVGTFRERSLQQAVTLTVEGDVVSAPRAHAHTTCACRGAPA